MNYTEINAKTIDQWVDKGWEWGKYVSHDEYLEAARGRWNVKLTPVKTVPQITKIGRASCRERV